MSLSEDPIFEPWSSEDAPAASPGWPPSSGEAQSDASDRRRATIEFLRLTAGKLMEAIGARLTLARHGVSFEDRLDEPEALLRFTLRPWPGPLPDAGLEGASMLEVGVSGESAETVTAWYWWDRSDEAPDEIAVVSRSELNASRLQQLIVDFVSRALRRR